MHVIRAMAAALLLTMSLTGCNSSSGPAASTPMTPQAASKPPASLPTSILAPEGEAWTLVWADEFEGDAIDSSKWTFDVDCWGGGNSERQCYTDDPRNAYVEGGMLKIVARKGASTGPAFPPYLQDTAAKRSATKTQPYSSARMVTKGKAAWKYGRIDVRAKLPQGQGTWPAIWMLPEDNVYGGWAMSGEIDIHGSGQLGHSLRRMPRRQGEHLFLARCISAGHGQTICSTAASCPCLVPSTSFTPTPSCGRGTVRLGDQWHAGCAPKRQLTGPPRRRMPPTPRSTSVFT